MPQCPTCGSAVSERDVICPDCGMDLTDGASTHVEVAMLPAPPVELTLQATNEAPPAEAAEAQAPAEPAVPDAQPEGDDAAVAEATSADEASSPEPAPALPATVEPRQETPGPSARITLRRGGTITSEVFQLGERAVLGRFDPETGPVDVDLAQLPEAVYVSRRHAEIWRDITGAWLIKDLGSANGTFVRAAEAPRFERVGDEQAVADGYEIGLGNARFEFHTTQ